MTTTTISIKPSSFDATSPNAWFSILEAQFNIASVTVSSTKFYHALSHLPTRTVSSLDDDILTSADYDKLKAAVISHHESTKPELFEQFMQSSTLSGRPSHHLAEMRKIAKKVGVTDDFLRHRFQQALPNNIAPIVASQSKLDLDAVGKLADELVSLFRRDDNVCSVDKPSQHTSHRPRSQTPRTTYTHKQDLTLTPFSEGQRSKICRSHIFFGPKARNCRSWCKWPEKSGCKIVESRQNSSLSRSASPENI